MKIDITQEQIQNIFKSTPEPVRTALQHLTQYYVPMVEFYPKNVSIAVYNWYANDSDYERLTLGIVHLTQENARIHAQALVSLAMLVTK